MRKNLQVEENTVIDEKWSNNVRLNAKELVEKADVAMMALGQVIYTIWEVPVGPKQQKLFKIWGFDSFKSYCETELALSYRRAAHLRNIWFALEVSCKDVPDATKKKLMALGYSKLREVCRILDADNASAIAAAAASMPVEDVASFVQRHIVTKKETAELEAEAKKNKDKSESKEPRDISSEDAEDSDEPSTKSVSYDSEDGNGEVVSPQPGGFVDDEGEEKSKNFEDLEGNEKLYQEHFMLYEQQQECLHEAIDAARRILNNPEAKKGHCLDLICTDFLSNNDFPGKDLTRIRDVYLTKVGRVLNLKVVAIDPKTGDVVHGIEVLEALARTEV